MATTRRPGARLGLLGLGGYGLGLCAIGVAGIAAPLFQARGTDQDPGETLARPQPGPAAGSPTGPQVGGTPVSVLLAAAAVRPLSTPSGVARSTSGVPGVANGDPGRRDPEFRPTMIVLPSGRTAQITPAGLLSDGSLSVPVDPKVVGWWDGGARASEPFGATVLAGHVDSLKYGLGALAELGKTHKGAVLELRADGHRQRYRVTGIQKIAQARLGTDTAAFNQEVSHRLVVITCGGPFDRGRHRYLDNIVITAVPVG
jgi:hypothetical protein